MQTIGGFVDSVCGFLGRHTESERRSIWLNFGIRLELYGFHSKRNDKPKRFEFISKRKMSFHSVNFSFWFGLGEIDNLLLLYSLPFYTHTHTHAAFRSIHKAF